MNLIKSSRKRKIKKLLIIIIPVLLLIIGTSFAFFTFYTSNEAFILTVNGVPMKVEFKEGTNVINAKYAYPISDEFAINNLDKLGYVDFTVSGGTPKNEYLYYELYLTEEEGNNLDPKYIKVYLTNDNDEKIIDPVIYDELEDSEKNLGKLIYNDTLTEIFEQKFRIYVWIDKEYSQNQEHQKFSFKINLHAYNTEKPSQIAVVAIKAKIGTDGLVGIPTTCSGDSCEAIKDSSTPAELIREYRYSGENVNNYVYFNCKNDMEQSSSNCETWRIIGIFKDADGTEKIKIVRDKELEDDVLPLEYTLNDDLKYKIKYPNDNKVYWDYDGIKSGSNWSNAGLMHWLNSTNENEDGYLKKLSTTSQNMISQTTYYLGNINITSYTTTDKNAIELYKEERGDTLCSNETQYCEAGKIWPNNQATWEGKIGLIYPSDVGFSMDGQYWNNELEWMTGGDHIESSWMKRKQTWCINPTNNSENSVSLLSPIGIGHSFTNSYSYVTPALYLESDVNITDGDGTSENPYQLSM